MAHVVELIYTEEYRGKGTELDPHRNVPQWWTFDGNLLFEIDEVLRTQQEIRRREAEGNNG